MWKFIVLFVFISFNANGQLAIFTYFDNDSLKIGNNKSLETDKFKLELLKKKDYIIEGNEDRLIDSIFYVTSYDSLGHLSNEYLLFRLTNHSNQNYYIPSFITGFVLLVGSTGYDYMGEIGGYYQSKFGDVILGVDSTTNTFDFKTYSIIQNKISKRKMKRSHLFFDSIKCFIKNLTSKKDTPKCNANKISNSISSKNLNKLRQLELVKPIHVKVNLQIIK